MLLLRPRRGALPLAVAGALIAGVAVGTVVHDWLTLRRASIDSETFPRRLEAEQHQIARLRASLGAVRREIEAWPKLEATITGPLDRVPPKRTITDPLDDADETLRRVQLGTATLEDTAALMTRLRDGVAALPTRWPVRAALNSPFGVRRSPYTDEPEFHRGVDIAAVEGTPVHAPASGNVVFAGRDGGYGLMVKVQHAADIQTRYGHLLQLAVRRGDRVERGQVVGRAGNTGRSTGAHLHYEVLVAGRAVNPKSFMWD